MILTMKGKGLQHEIGKRHPFKSEEQEVYLNLARTQSILSAQFSRLFRAHGLSDATYNTLRILRGAGDAGRTCGEIREMLVTEVPDVTRLVDRLVKEGMATRARGSADRRVVKVVISKKGLDRLAELDAPVMELHERQLGHLSAEKLRTLSALLEAARTGDGPVSGCSGA